MSSSGSSETKSIMAATNTPNAYERSLIPELDHKQDLDPRGRAPAWASNRNDLSETLDYFHNMQGGVYTMDKVILGILLDKHGGVRSYMDAEIVITRISGSDQHNTAPSFAKFRLESAQNNMKKNHPVGIIIGKDYPHPDIRFTGPAQYAVMGLYWITDLWQEKIGIEKYCRIRLQKVDLQSKSWFTPKRQEPPAQIWRTYDRPLASRTCGTCQQTSMQRYAEAWFCGNPDCQHFSTDNGTIHTGDLTFAEDYLIHRSQPPAPGTWGSNINLTPDKFNPLLPLRDLWRGSVCPSASCRKCVSRIFWDRWECTDCHQSVVVPPRTPGPADRFKVPGMNWSMSRTQDPQILNDVRFLIRSNVQIRDKMYNLHRKDLPANAGTIYLLDPVSRIAPDDRVPPRMDFVDEVWDHLTAGAHARRIPLKRCLFRDATDRTGLRTRSFQGNYGEPYNYSAQVETAADFDSAPQVIQALKQIAEEAERAVLPASDLPEVPNELLLAGYWSEQGMNWHTDGEAEVGSPISTFSVGCPAHMDWAWIPSWYHHKEFKDRHWIIRDGDPLEGSKYYDAIQDLPMNLHPDERERQRIAIIDAGGNPTSRSDPPAFLSANLWHGSFVFMVGAEMATKVRVSYIPCHHPICVLVTRLSDTAFKHNIQPLGDMRIAATFRRLDNTVIKGAIDSKGNPVSGTKRKRDKGGDDSEDTESPKKTRKVAGGERSQGTRRSARTKQVKT